MNSNPLRGLAALALLCLLPRASALTVTHSTQLSDTAWTGNLMTYWTVPQYVGVLPLQSVRFDIIIDTQVTIVELNPLSIPITWTKEFNPQSSALLLSPSILWLGTTITTTISGGSQVLAPGDSASYNASAHQVLTHTITGESAIARFYDGAKNLLSTSTSSLPVTGWGSTFSTQTVNASVTYFAAPDGGETWALLASVSIGMVAFHRRRIRRRPGA